MERTANLLTRAREAACLDQRIAQNTGAQELDLVEWIFERLPVATSSTVLELCAGTGAQTLPLLERAGKAGHVFAVDVSEDALGRLAKKVPLEHKSCLTLLKSDMDQFEDALTVQGLANLSFDLVFCAYGLYYSNSAIATLEAMRSRLRPDGRLAVVGPFGPNNAPLYALLNEGGVEIPDFVRYTSGDFMLSEVAPWASVRFQELRVFSTVNRVVWRSQAEVFSYWNASTFFDETRADSVKKLLDRHFSTNATFVNEKWIMLIEAVLAR